jgi:hypothetical protein
MKTIKTMINAMASRWRNRVPPQEKQAAGTDEDCPHSGATPAVQLRGRDALGH